MSLIREINKRRLVHTLGFVYSQPTNLLVAIVSFLAYYALFLSIITYSNFGVFFITIPMAYLLLLMLSASVLLSLSFAYAKQAHGTGRARYGGATSPVTVVVGSFVASCTCVAPLVAPILYFFGFNALEVSGFLTLLQNLQISLFSAFIGLNLIATLFLLAALSQSLRLSADYRHL